VTAHVPDAGQLAAALAPVERAREHLVPLVGELAALRRTVCAQIDALEAEASRALRGVNVALESLRAHQARPGGDGVGQTGTGESRLPAILVAQDAAAIRDGWPK